MFDETTPEPPNPLWSCDIRPWLAELHQRMQEAHAVQSNVVNLSYAHPRGFFPGIILRRRAVRDYMKQAQAGGWLFNIEKNPPAPYPDHVWMPKKGLDLNICPTAPFEREMALREEEAKREAALRQQQTGMKHVPIVDLTNWHPRGGIPPEILRRIERRRDRRWVEETNSEVQRLFGEANRMEALAKTQREKAEGFKQNGRDGSNYLAAAEKAETDADSLRAQARILRSELGEAA